MIKLNINEYRDKIYACWLGKNIGGTMGGPYEGTREVLNIKGFATPKGEIIPNDDLDLQLVWLAACERIGANNVTPEELGEYWLSYVAPHWNEYGLCKANMRRGLIPPLSGDYNNVWKDSNGAWIRTEIWACLAPACPDIAVKYAFMDACVDHGTAEGTTSAMFVAAIESAAFAENNVENLIKIGLSKIPAKSRMAKSIKLLLKCYKEGKTWREARDLIFEQNKDIGDGWFQAPSNVCYAMIGLLWGEGDFKKSMITAINCGDDTDCTGATIGSVLGIMHGTKIIPKEWKEHIGDRIDIACVNFGTIYALPKSCTELTDRIIALQPSFIWDNVVPPKVLPVVITDQKTSVPKQDLKDMYNGEYAASLCHKPKYSFEKDFGYIKASVWYDKEPTLKPGESIKVNMSFRNNCDIYGIFPHNIDLKWFLPEGFSITGPKTLTVPHTLCDNDHTANATFVITAESTEQSNELVLEISNQARLKKAFIPLVILGK